MKRNNTKQSGAAIFVIVAIFVLAGLLLTGGAVIAGIGTVDYSAIGQANNINTGSIARPTGEGTVEDVAGNGAHVNGDRSRPFIPCRKQNSGMWCGRAAAQMVIKGYTGKLISQGSMQSGGSTIWPSVLMNNVEGSWTAKRYDTDNMEGVINTIEGGDAVIIYTINPASRGSYGHIMPVMQYDRDKDAFLVNNSGTSGCQMHWVSRSFFLNNPHSTANHRWRGP